VLYFDLLGIPIDELREELDSLKSGHEKLVSEGRLFAYVYTAEGPRLQLQVQFVNTLNFSAMFR